MDKAKVMELANKILNANKKLPPIRNGDNKKMEERL